MSQGDSVSEPQLLWHYRYPQAASVLCQGSRAGILPSSAHFDGKAEHSCSQSLENSSISPITHFLNRKYQISADLPVLLGLLKGTAMS